MHENIQYLTTESDAPFVVEMAGISYCDGSYRIHRSQSSITVVEFVVQGQGEIVEENRRFQAGPGDVYILHQGYSHTYFADAKDPWEKIWFNVRGPVVTGLLAAYGLDRTNLVTGCPQAVQKYFFDFLETTRRNESLNDRFAACGLIFHQLMQKLSGLKPATSFEHSEAALLRDHIRHNLHRPVTLGELSEKIYRSKAYTIKLFREHFQTTPYAYLIRCRLEAACHLLAETRLPIKSIALKLCFADQHYFSTVFKKHIGLPPRAYRQQQQDSSPSFKRPGT